MDDENDIPTRRKFHVDLKELINEHGRDEIALVVTEETEVIIGIYEVDEEAQEGDVFVRTQPGMYAGTDVVFRRLVPLSADEQALVQAVYDKTKDFTW